MYEDLDILLSLALAAELNQSDASVVAVALRIGPKVTNAQRRGLLSRVLHSRTPLDTVWQEVEAYKPPMLGI